MPLCYAHDLTGEEGVNHCAAAANGAMVAPGAAPPPTTPAAAAEAAAAAASLQQQQPRSEDAAEALQVLAGSAEGRSVPQALGAMARGQRDLMRELLELRRYVAANTKQINTLVAMMPGEA